MPVNTLADPSAVGALAALMRLLGDGTRIRILGLLLTDEMNVTAICGQLDLAQPTVSHHLGLLRAGGFLKTRRAGKQVFYSVDSRQVLTDQSNGTLHLQQGPVRLSLGSANDGA